MNERINELAEQAVTRFDKDMDGSMEPEESGRWVQFEDLEKFAELIVRECAELFVDQKYMILNPYEPFANERVRALKEHDKDTVRKIKQHFGVEEK
jgi:hypothetical protein